MWHSPTGPSTSKEYPLSDHTRSERSSTIINLGIVGIKLAPKLIKLFLVAGSVAAYSFLFTWQFALIIVGAVFIHECGHLIAMKRFGLKTKGIYMIPFVGGAAVAEEAFPTRRVEGITALTGPIVGFALSLVGLGLYELTKDPLWAAAASWNALVNLFNLLPVTPLDGGRVVKSAILSLNSRLNTVLFLIMVALAITVMVTQQIWIFALLLVVGTLEFFGERRQRTKAKKRFEAEMAEWEEDPWGPRPTLKVTSTLEPMTPRGAWLTLGGYVLLAVALYGVMYVTSHEPGAGAAMEVLIG